MAQKHVTVKFGFPVFGLLLLFQVILITLKLVGVITASWVWVLFPMWIGPAVLLGLAAICLVIGLSLLAAWGVFILVVKIGEWSKDWA
jgi:hypothetical protein